MSRAEIGDVALVDGRLAQVVSILEGHREVTFEFVGGHPCPTCGRDDRIDLVEGSMLWRDLVRAPKTCGGSP